MTNPTEDKFGKWTVLSWDKIRKGASYLLRCRCECGTERLIQENHLRKGITGGCNKCSRRNKTHGDSQSKMYRRWMEMIGRCERKSSGNYRYYGERGVKVCNEWHKYETFKAWAILNGYDDALTIDRINNRLGYSPENCRFIPAPQQHLNKTDNRLLSVGDETKPLVAWARDSRCAVSYAALESRIRHGWGHEKAIMEGRKNASRR